MHIEVPHDCGRTHHGWQSLAECTWPEAAWVVGAGPVALVARCDLVAVSLYETMAEAKSHLRRLDAVGCGKTCEGDHSIVALRSDAAAGATSVEEWLATS